MGKHHPKEQSEQDVYTRHDPNSFGKLRVLHKELYQGKPTYEEMGKVANSNGPVVDPPNHISFGHPIEHGKAKIKCADNLNEELEYDRGTWQKTIRCLAGKERQAKTNNSK